MDPGTTKNHEGREATVTQSVRALLIQAMIGKQPDDYLFSRVNGNPISDFRGSWERHARLQAFQRCYFTICVVLLFGTWCGLEFRNEWRC